MRRMILAGAVVIGFSAPSIADPLTGNRLQALCLASKGSALVEPAFLLGYVTATSDDIRSMDTASTRICIPSDATYGQIRTVVCRYVDQHPERRNIRATTLTRDAYADAWPCPK